VGVSTERTTETQALGNRHNKLGLGRTYTQSYTYLPLPLPLPLSYSYTSINNNRRWRGDGAHQPPPTHNALFKPAPRPILPSSS